MAARGNMEVRQNVQFDDLVTNLARILVYVPKHMILFASSDSTANIIDAEEADKERFHTIATVQATSK